MDIINFINSLNRGENTFYDRESKEVVHVYEDQIEEVFTTEFRRNAKSGAVIEVYTKDGKRISVNIMNLQSELQAKDMKEASPNKTIEPGDVEKATKNVTSGGLNRATNELNNEVKEKENRSPEGR